VDFLTFRLTRSQLRTLTAGSVLSTLALVVLSLRATYRPGFVVVDAALTAMSIALAVSFRLNPDGPLIAIVSIDEVPDPELWECSCATRSTFID
jgi:hypothetical protein